MLCEAEIIRPRPGLSGLSALSQPSRNESTQLPPAGGPGCGKRTQSGRLGIGDCGLGIWAGGEPRMPNEPNRRQASASRRLPLPSGGRGSRRVKRSQFAEAISRSAGAGRAKRSQFALFWARNGVGRAKRTQSRGWRRFPWRGGSGWRKCVNLVATRRMMPGVPWCHIRIWNG